MIRDRKHCPKNMLDTDHMISIMGCSRKGIAPPLSAGNMGDSSRLLWIGVDVGGLNISANIINSKDGTDFI